MPRKIPNYQLALFDIYSEGSLPLFIMGFQNSYKKMSCKFLENEKIGLHFIETFFFSFSHSIIRCLWKRYDMEARYWEAQCPPLLKTTHIVDMGNGEEGGPWILIEGIMHYVMNTIVSFATVNEWMFRIIENTPFIEHTKICITMVIMTMYLSVKGHFIKI